MRIGYSAYAYYRITASVRVKLVFKLFNVFGNSALADAVDVSVRNFIGAFSENGTFFPVLTVVGMIGIVMRNEVFLLSARALGKMPCTVVSCFELADVRRGIVRVFCSAGGTFTADVFMIACCRRCNVESKRRAVYCYAVIDFSAFGTGCSILAFRIRAVGEFGKSFRLRYVNK